MPLSLAVVEDEPLAMSLLVRWLGECDDVRIVGTAATVSEATKMIERADIDAIFLDINLAGENGFWIAEHGYREQAFDVVFVSAHADYALPAFRVEAADFLSKPFTRQQLHAAVERVRLRHTQRALTAPKEPPRIRIRQGDQTFVVAGPQIQWIESAGGYCVVHTDSERHLSNETLSDLLAHLGAPFLRIHRSVLVNATCIARVQSLSHGDALLHLHSGAELRLSRRYRDALSAAGYA